MKWELIKSPIEFLNDFFVAFDQFAQSISRGNEYGDLIHFFRYLYFIRRFIDVAKASDLIKIKQEEKVVPATKKKNEEYLQNAQRRYLILNSTNRLIHSSHRGEREGSIHREHVREEEEVFGINFVEWAQNLDEIERENRIIKSNLHAEKVKAENEEKRQRLLEEKKHAALEFEYDKKQVGFLFRLDQSLILCFP